MKSNMKSIKADSLKARIIGAMKTSRFDVDYVAHKCGMSRTTWYRKMKNPRLFTVGDLVTIERLTGAHLLKGD